MLCGCCQHDASYSSATYNFVQTIYICESKEQLTIQYQGLLDLVRRISISICMSE
jgi:hypothetical protein